MSVIALLLVLYGVHSAQAQGLDNRVSLPIVAAKPRATPSPTPVSSPNPTPNPSPTANPDPNPGPGNGTEPYPDAPACPSHDDRAYHGLWDAERGCHYDHTHGDNPHDVDDVFGTEYYSWAGGEVSYPWQTTNENLLKHGAYVWLVRSDLPCVSDFEDGCITDFRAQVHADGAAQGAVVSYHSAWMEARVCRESDPNDCGIVRVGGWQGPVDLFVDRERVLDREGNANRFFLHYYNTGNDKFGTWYTGAESGMYSVVPQIEDMWNTVPPRATAEEIVADSEWFCADAQGNLVTERCQYNSSRIQAHVVEFRVSNPVRQAIDADGDGYGNFNGFTDRYGRINPHCTSIGPECVPFQVENVAVDIGYQSRNDAREYDIYFCDGVVCTPPGPGGRAVPSGWINFPIHTH